MIIKENDKELQYSRSNTYISENMSPIDVSLDFVYVEACVKKFLLIILRWKENFLRVLLFRWLTSLFSWGFVITYF